MDLRDGSLGEVAADRFTARDAIRTIPLPEPLRRLELGDWSGREQIALVDVETGAWRGLQAVDERRLAVSLSRDGQTLLVEQETVDGDLWMLELPDGDE